MVHRLALVALLVLGCSDSSTPSSQPKTPQQPPPAAAPPPGNAAASVLTDPHRFDCKVDADCMNSCEYGAVSASWYRAAEATPELHECEDGCANQISAPPRCEQGGCVAYQVDPHDERVVTKSDYCTRVNR